MINIHEFEVPQCISCDGYKSPTMLRVGALLFCKECKKKIFGEINMINVPSKEYNVYLHWLHKWKEMIK